MATPTLTIITPAYNAARYLPRCLDSLLAQTYTDFELIVINNGSTDDTLAVCRRYADEHSSRIHAIDLPTAGVSAARNAGLECARGRYVTFADADDWFEPEYLAEFFREPLPESDMVVFQNIRSDFSECPGREGEMSWITDYTDAEFTFGDDPQTAMQLQLLHEGYTSCKLYDLDLIRRHHVRFLTEVAGHEDHVFFFHYLQYAQKVIWRKGTWIHYMRYPQPTLCERPMAVEVHVSAVALFDQMLPIILRRLGITDPTYGRELYNELCLLKLLLASYQMKRSNYLLELRALKAHREQFVHMSKWGATLLTKKVWWMLNHLPERLYFLIFWQMQFRKFLLRLRGRIQ